MRGVMEKRDVEIGIYIIYIVLSKQQTTRWRFEMRYIETFQSSSRFIYVIVNTKEASMMTR
jgi:hypothetical protein